MNQRTSKPRLSSGPTGTAFRARGFTLLEIMIVLSLLALLAAFAWPNLQGQIVTAELPQSAEQLRSTLYMARSDAVMEHRRFRVRFVSGDQQPIIEWEPDPIEAPGVFEPSKSPWTKEPVLLADVQVHRVTTGRPEWTWPISTTSQDEQELAKAEKRRQEQTDEEKIQEQKFLRGALIAGEGAADDDPYRPMIVFGSDGSAEWATFVLARLDPEEDLTEEMEQIWVVLDGRTGLATIREQVTEDQLSDPNFYVAREKLDLPDTTDIEDLAFNIGDDTGTGQGAAGGDQTGTLTGGQTPDLTSLQPVGSAAANAGQKQPGDSSGGDQRTGTTAANPPAGKSGEIGVGGSGASDSDRDGDGSKPEDKADDPNLTKEEKDNIRKWLSGNK